MWVYQHVFFLFVRHEAALRWSDRQHVPCEDHQWGEADGDLQPGRSESRKGSVIPQTRLLLSLGSLLRSENEDHLSDTTFLINITSSSLKRLIAVFKNMKMHRYFSYGTFETILHSCWHCVLKVAFLYFGQTLIFFEIASLISQHN